MDSTVQFINEPACGFAHDGWAQLAPLGDFTAPAIQQQHDGSTHSFNSLQRLDRRSAELMVRHFNSCRSRSIPIYLGHPDAPGRFNEPRDPKGYIADLQIREDGLFCKPVSSNAGVQLLESDERLALSGHWTSSHLGDQLFQGKNLPAYRPCSLLSAGLTPCPNLPVEFLNTGVEFTNVVEFSNASSRGQLVKELVELEMRRNGGDYTSAFTFVQRKNPALFAAMKQPKIQFSKP